MKYFLFCVFLLKSFRDDGGLAHAFQQQNVPKNLRQKYLRSLGIDEDKLDDHPTIKNLEILTKSHLEKIPFANVRLHSTSCLPVSMDINHLSEQLLDRSLGGVCYELNGAFAVLLQDLGYNVKLLPSLGFYGDGERPMQTSKHMALLVETDDSKIPLYVDVGDGEPPISPLEYKMDVEQTTPEGMMSRFREEDELVVYERYVPKYGSWMPRMMWSDHEEARKSRENLTLHDFEDELLNSLGMNSEFGKKPFACRLTKDEKVTLIGNKVKRTKRRFQHDQHVEEHVMESKDEVRKILKDEYGIPYHETATLKPDENDSVLA